MNTFTIGRQAEAAAAQYLLRHHFQLLEQNYRTRYCEIDIIATKADVVYFVEVKYRQSDRQGAGIEYITPKKLERMQFAAEHWLYEHARDEEAYQLAALEVSGDAFSVTNFIPSLT